MSHDPPPSDLRVADGMSPRSMSRLQEFLHELAERADGDEISHLLQQIVRQAENQLLQSMIIAISESSDFDAALEVVLRQVCEVTGWSFGEVWLPTADGLRLECSPIGYVQNSQLCSFREFSREQTFALGEGLPGRVWASGLPEWHPDVSVVPEIIFLRAEAAKQAGLRAGLGVPIRAKKRVLAVLVFFMAEAHAEDKVLVEEVVAIAAQLGAVMQLKQTEAALSESQRRLTRLIDSLPGIVFTCASDPDWSMSYLSEGCLSLLGYHQKELVGPHRHVTYNDLTHPDDLSMVLVQINEAIAHKRPYVTEYRIRTKTGEEKWLWEQGYGVFDAEGQILGLEGFISDITERKHAEEALRRAEEKYRGIFENAVEGMFQTTPEGRYIMVNPMLVKIYGYESPTALIETLTDIQHQLYVDSTRRIEFSHLLQDQDAVWGFESEVYRRDGSKIWISENARAMRDAEGRLLGYEGIVADITERKQAEITLRRRDALLQGVADATRHLLTESDYRQAIAQALAILGTAAGVDRVYIYENHPHLATGEIAISMRYEWTRPEILPSIQGAHWQNQPYSTFGLTHWYSAFSVGQSVGGITRQMSQSEQELLGRDKILSILMVPIFVEDHFWGLIGFDDCQTERDWSRSEELILKAIAASIGGVLQRHWNEEVIRYQAFHDLLTGLPNRVLFNERLQQSLAQAELEQETLAVMFLDLDRFKTINDTLGHAIGDQLLQTATQRLVGCLRDSDMIARWGGDEFTLLLPLVNSVDDVAKIAQRILDAMKPTFLLNGHELYVTSSIGIALYPQDGKDAQTLLKNADAALYRVKEQGRNHYQFHTAIISSQASERLALDNSLHHALERKEFVVYYQPQINVATGEVTQMEALLRWQHPTLGIVSPRTFIALAEENGLIEPIGEWVLRVACEQAKTWHEMGLSSLRIAVNLSARQFQQPQLAHQVATVLAEIGLEPHFLELEITETATMQNVEFTQAILKELRDMGVRISVDDFGTGYASLSYLKQFPLHTLKIDQSFVQDLTDQPEDLAIITAIITLGRGLNLNVVAEGVETIEQMERLRSLHCKEMQGYWFSKPLDAIAATQFLQTHSSTPYSSTPFAVTKTAAKTANHSYTADEYHLAGAAPAPIAPLQSQPQTLYKPQDRSQPPSTHWDQPSRSPLPPASGPATVNQPPQKAP